MPFGNTALHKALINFKGDIESINSFLDRNYSEINDGNSAGETPIHKAVENEACTIELLQLLMEYGANINVVTLEGNTALHLLTIRGEGGRFDQNREVDNESVVEWTKLVEFIMVESDHDVNTVNFENDTMLHFYLKNFKTSLRTHLKIFFNVFLQNVCDINAVNLAYETPLHLIVRDEVLCDVFLIKLLIDLGADVCIRDRSGENVYEAYRKAVERDNREVYPVLQMQLAQEDERKRYMNSSLHLACLFRNVESVHKMLKLGVNVNGIDAVGGHLPLYYVVMSHEIVVNRFKLHDHEKCSKCPIVKLLLEYGADLNFQISITDGTYNVIASELLMLNSHSSRDVFYQYFAKIWALQEKQAEKGINLLIKPDRRLLESGFALSPNSNYRRFLQESSIKELNAMIETKIGKSAISFYNFLLLANAKEMAMYAKNKELVRAFHAGKVAFPLYQGILDAKFARHLERRKLIETVAVLLSEILKFADPSNEFYERTLSYLSNEELKRLIDGDVNEAVDNS